MTPKLKRILISLIIAIGICLLVGLLATLFANHLDAIAKMFSDNGAVLYNARKFSKRVHVLPVFVLIGGGAILFMVTFLLWNKKKWIYILCDVLLGLILLAGTILLTQYEDVVFYQVVRLLLG